MEQVGINLKTKQEMNRLFLILFAAITTAFMVATTGCSQNKQQTKPSVTAKSGNNAKDKDKTSTSAQGTTAGNGKVNYLTTAEFKQKVMNYEKHPQEWVFEGSRPVIIDFYATWCGPCKRTAPIVEELAQNYQGKIDFYKVDVDKEQELAATFGIQSIPTFLFIPTKGQPTMQMGAMQKSDFEEIIQSVIFK